MRADALQVHSVPDGGRPSAWTALRALAAPLALYAALAWAFCALFDAPLFAPALLFGAAVLAAGELLPARAGRLLRLSAVVGAMLAFALAPAVRAGAPLLANRLFGASEAVNAYAYRYFAAPAAEVPTALRACLAATAAFGGAFCALVSRRRGAVVALFLVTAFVEAYFGVTPPAWRNLALFAAFGVLLARGERKAPSFADAATVLAGFAAVAIAVFLLAPRPNAAVETYSERLRDELGAAASAVLPDAMKPPEASRAHRESRQHEEPANADGAREQARQEFEHRTENERELALPRRIDYLRIALLLLAVAALLIVPFLPFMLLERAKRRAAARRAAFHDADNAAAIRAMFLHVMDWLHACGLPEGNRLFSDETEAVRALTSDDYAARYAAAVPIWQEAAYSGHELAEDQRIAVRRLLETTETLLYERADRRTRFRLKYIECLCG